MNFIELNKEQNKNIYLYKPKILVFVYLNYAFLVGIS